MSRVSRFFQHMSKVFESWVLTPTSRRLLSVEGFSTDVKCVKGCPTICSNLCSAILLWFFLPPLPSASHFDVIFFLQKSSYVFFKKVLKKGSGSRPHAPPMGVGREEQQQEEKKREKVAPRPAHPWGVWGSGHGPTVKRAVSGCPPMAPAS